jgi:hypothetical protein
VETLLYLTWRFTVKGKKWLRQYGREV